MLRSTRRVTLAQKTIANDVDKSKISIMQGRCLVVLSKSSLLSPKRRFLFLVFSTSSMRYLHRLCKVLFGGGGRDFVLSFLPSSPPPSAATSYPPFVDVSSFFLSLFPLSSGVAVQPALVHPALPSRSPLSSFHPLQPCRSRFYGGVQLRLSPSQICRLSFLHSSDAPLQGHPHRPSYPPMSSPPCSSHHAPPCGLHAHVQGSHAPARASHAPPCPPQATARSSSANLLPLGPLLHPLLRGFFCCFFIFLVLLFLCISVFILFFVGFNLPAMMWSDLEEEIDDGGRPLAPIWFFVVLALQLLLCNDGCFTRIGLFTEFLCNLHCLVQP
jgi:hypothetical protein